MSSAGCPRCHCPKPQDLVLCVPELGAAFRTLNKNNKKSHCNKLSRAEQTGSELLVL